MLEGVAGAIPALAIGAGERPVAAGHRVNRRHQDRPAGIKRSPPGSSDARAPRFIVYGVTWSAQATIKQRVRPATTARSLLLPVMISIGLWAASRRMWLGIVSA